MKVYIYSYNERLIDCCDKISNNAYKHKILNSKSLTNIFIYSSLFYYFIIKYCINYKKNSVYIFFFVLSVEYSIF